MNKLALLVLLPLAANADMIGPSHNCIRPSQPSAFSSDAERITFDRQAGLYRQCLSDFIDQQEREARMHGDAARKAGEELRQFGQ